MVAYKIQLGAGITVGAGVGLGESTSYSITLQSSDFFNGYSYNTGTVQYPIPLGTNGVDGFTVDFSHIPPDNSNWIYTAFSPYYVNINSQPVADFFNNTVAAGALAYASQPALWSVSWALGSSINTGYVIMSGTNAFNGALLIAPVDTAVTGWNTSPPDNGTTTELAGTFLFPATFTLVTPAIDKGGWC